MSQNQDYVFYIQSPILTECQVVCVKQSLDFYDNNVLGGIEFKSLNQCGIS
jgi:hypothetical protein